ncbi:MAG: hypothetical protein ACLRZ9_00220 [Eubacterium sp.]
MKLKKHIALLMIAVILVSTNDLNVSADGNNEKIELERNSFHNLEDNYDEDSALCKKLEYDAENDVTDLSTDKEERLNCLGVFDEDIQKLNGESLEKIEKAENIEITIEYSQVNDLSENQTKMSNDEIDSIVEEQIEENKLNYEEEHGIINQILEKIGVLPVNINASAPIARDSESGTSASGAMKQIIYACQYKKGTKVEVIATATWLKDAYYKNKDVFGVSLKNATVVNKTSKCYHTGTLKYYYGGKWNSKYYSTNPTAKTVSTDGIAYTVNLFGTRGVGVLADSDAGYFENETIMITFDCNVDNTKIKKIVLVPHYKHSKTSKSISPNVSVSTSGISVSVSGSTKNYYEEITRNPLLEFYYKK